MAGNRVANFGIKNFRHIFLLEREKFEGVSKPSLVSRGRGPPWLPSNVSGNEYRPLSVSPLADTPVDELARLPFHLFRLSLLFVCVPVCAFVCRDSASLSLRMLAVLSGSPSFPPPLSLPQRSRG